jgi:hypothetical protein
MIIYRRCIVAGLLLSIGAPAALGQDELIDGAVRAGWLQGVRSVEVIRSDVLCVTIDAGITGAIEPTAYRAANVPKHRARLEPYTRPDAFAITSETDPDYRVPVRPAEVGQCSYEGRNSIQHSRDRPSCTIFHTECYLFLPRPIQSGHRYEVKVRPRVRGDRRLADSAAIDYDDARTITRAIKVNQVAYGSRAARRYAYLGWWAGRKGPVDYDGLGRFEVIDEANGRTSFEGRLTPRARDDVTAKMTGEILYDLDLSALPAGRYHVRIPGLGRSDGFAVGGAGVHAMYYHALRAFFHQRCGQEFREPWTWVRKPACHSEVLASGLMPEGSPLVIPEPGGEAMPKTERPRPGERPRRFRGGYHDAADYDVFTYHLPATSELITVHEIFPDAFRDGDLDLPESGNGIPDILDEAAWGLGAFLELQEPDGAVPLGRANLQDALTQNLEGGYERGKDAGVIPPYGIIPPHGESTPTFAAVAAQFSRVIRKHDAARADRYLAAAERAFAYATAHTPEQIRAAYLSPRSPLKPEEDRGHEAWDRCCAWAAAELLRATGGARYRDDLRAHRDRIPLGAWQYSTPRLWALAHAEAADPDIRQRGRDDLIAQADEIVRTTLANPYRMSSPGWGQRPGGWGSMQGIDASGGLVRAYALTRDRKYLDALSLNADWHLGCNPRSETWLTRTGARYPRRPEISHFLYERPFEDLGGPTIRGLSTYGAGLPLTDWFGPWPAHRSRRDVWDDGAEVYSEFTVPQTLAPAAVTYATLYAIEQRAGTIPPGSKPDPLGR